MAYYRLYFMDPEKGTIRTVEELDMAGDDEAIAHAEGRVGANPLELWCRHRRVRQFPAVSDHPARPRRGIARNG